MPGALRRGLPYTLDSEDCGEQKPCGNTALFWHADHDLSGRTSRVIGSHGAFDNNNRPLPARGFENDSPESTREIKAGASLASSPSAAARS